MMKTPDFFSSVRQNFFRLETWKDRRSAYLYSAILLSLLPVCLPIFAFIALFDMFQYMSVFLQKRRGSQRYRSSDIRKLRKQYGNIIYSENLNTQLPHDACFILLCLISYLLMILTTPLYPLLYGILSVLAILTACFIWKSMPWLWHSIYRIHCEQSAGINPEEAPKASIIGTYSLFFSTLPLPLAGALNLKFFLYGWLLDSMDKANNNPSEIYVLEMQIAFFLIPMIVTCLGWGWVYYYRSDYLRAERKKIKEAKQLLREQRKEMEKCKQY